MQTIWAARISRTSPFYDLPVTRERMHTPDGDFVDVDWIRLCGAPSIARPLFILFHGLEGTHESHYVQAFASAALQLNMDFAIPYFRSCSGEINRAPRAYHSGDWQEIDWILRELHRRHRGQKVAAGVSLGGNALARWAGEVGHAATQTISAMAAICSPLDMIASGSALSHGLNRTIYAKSFLNTLKPKALAKWTQYPGLFDKTALLAANDLYDFDQVFTAPVHGFRHVEDYWTRASAKPHLHAIRVPTLLLNAQNDPFVPVRSLPTVNDCSVYVELWQPQQGGHVGFCHGPWARKLDLMPQSVVHWFQQFLIKPNFST